MNGDDEPLNPSSGGGHLNPCFVEWMMGLPLNWTKPKTAPVARMISTIRRSRRGSTRAVTPSSDGPPPQLSMFSGLASPASEPKEG